MDISGIASQPSPLSNVSLPPAPQVAEATPPTAPLPPSAIPPQGMQGMPLIQNMMTNPANPLASPVSVGQPPPGGLAEVAAASQSVANDLIEDKQADDAHELTEVEAKDNSVLANDEELLKDMQQTLRRQTDEVSRKVTRSAFKYAFKHTDWLNKEMASEAETFFTIKVPKVLAEELSKILNDALGLSEPTPS